MADTLPPTTIGPYRIQRELGRGGMGVVYLASDPRLDRSVAIKVLPEQVAHEPEKLARLSREARALATLNHPNVAAIYGLEEQPATNGGKSSVLVLEYVPGPTLTERLGAGPVPIDEALRIMAQVAAGLEAAHERGLIHRDLKPDNIKVTPEGQAKVLDFGLAKPESAFAADVTTTVGATMPIGTTTPMVTRRGVVMGTPGYMSPEQCRGKPLDKRTDIWSFGCVLFECLTGKQAFKGETLSDAIAAVLEREPDFAVLPARTPPRVRELLGKCLEKDSSRRLRDIGDAKLELEQAISRREWTSTSGMAPVGTGEFRPARQRLQVNPWLFVIGFLALGVGVYFKGTVDGSKLAATTSEQPVYKLALPLPGDVKPVGWMIPSPDGRSLCYLISKPDPQNSGSTTTALRWMRLDGQGEGELEGSQDVTNAAFSPDGRTLAILHSRPGQQGMLSTVTMRDGQPSGPLTMAADSVAKDSELCFVDSDSVFLARRNEAAKMELLNLKTGQRRDLYSMPPNSQVSAWMAPSVLPGGKQILISHLEGRGQAVKFAIYTLSVDGGEPVKVLDNAFLGRFVRPGYLIYMRGEALVASVFDPSTLTVSGAPIALNVGKVGMTQGFNASPEGVVVISSASPTQGAVKRLVRIGADGKAEPIGTLQRPMAQFFALSPDGERAVMGVLGGAQGLTFEVWAADLKRDTMTRIDGDGLTSIKAIWHPDGQRIAWSRFDADGTTTIFMNRADGVAAPEVLHRQPAGPYVAVPLSFSADGKYLFMGRAMRNGEKIEALSIDLSKKPEERGEPTLIRTTTNGNGMGVVSRDGRLIAYASDASGHEELFVERFSFERSAPADQVRVQVSTQGSRGRCWWNADSTELRYVGGNQIWSVAITREPTLRVGNPKAILTIDPSAEDASGSTLWDWTPDGQLVRLLPVSTDRGQYMVVTGVQELIKRAMASGK